MGKAAGLVYSDWIDSFVPVSIRKVSGLHDEKSRNGLGMGEWVGGNWW